MAAQSPLTRGANGPRTTCRHPFSSTSPFTAAIASRIQDAEMEKHAHGCLNDEVSIMASGGGTIDPAHGSGTSIMIKERELELEAERCPEME